MSNATLSLEGYNSYEPINVDEKLDSPTQPHSTTTQVFGRPEFIVYRIQTEKLKSSFIFLTNLVILKKRKDELASKINLFATLEKDWNSYGSIAIDSNTKNHSINIINQLSLFSLSSITSIFPYPHGTVGIKWRNKNTEEIASLEIGNNSFSCYSKRINQPTIELDGSITSEGLEKPILNQLENEIRLLAVK